VVVLVLVVLVGLVVLVALVVLVLLVPLVLLGIPQSTVGTGYDELKFAMLGKTSASSSFCKPIHLLMGTRTFSYGYLGTTCSENTFATT